MPVLWIRIRTRSVDSLVINPGRKSSLGKGKTASGRANSFGKGKTALERSKQPWKDQNSLGQGKTAPEAVFRIRIHVFFGLPDPDPLVRGMDPDPALNPDPSIIMQK